MVVVVVAAAAGAVQRRGWRCPGDPRLRPLSRLRHRPPARPGHGCQPTPACQRQRRPARLRPLWAPQRQTPSAALPAVRTTVEVACSSEGAAARRRTGPACPGKALLSGRVGNGT